ncbi:hypothetical protein QYF36_005082 [Acer negundo]|nr:hypothetical protein QYF36_005082 [Acer negundo]
MTTPSCPVRASDSSGELVAHEQDEKFKKRNEEGDEECDPVSMALVGHQAKKWESGNAHSVNLAFLPPLRINCPAMPYSSENNAFQQAMCELELKVVDQYKCSLAFGDFIYREYYNGMKTVHNFYSAKKQGTEKTVNRFKGFMEEK